MPHRYARRTAATLLATAAAAAAAVALGVTGSADAQNLSTSNCPRGLDGQIHIRGQTCFQFIGNEVRWYEARSFCHQRNGRLVAVTDSGLQSWLSATASTLWPRKQGVWLGMNRVSNTFVWDGYDDTPQTGNYFNWANGFPTDDVLGLKNCVYMRRDYDWGWANIVCNVFTNTYNYICEYPVVYTNITTASRPPVTNGASTPSPTGIGPDATAFLVTKYYATTSRGFTNQTASNASIGPDTTVSLVTNSYATTSRGFTNQTASNATSSSSRSTLVVPLSAAAAALVVVLLLIAALLVYLRRRRRCGMPNAGNGVPTSRSTVVVENPLYTSDTAGLVDASPDGDVPDVNTDSRHRRPPSNIYVDMGTEEASKNQERPLQDSDTGPLYAEPFQSSQQPNSSCNDCSAAPAKPTGSSPTYHQYTYIDVAPLLKSQLEATAPDAGAQDYEAVASPVTSSKDAPQDGYEPFQSQWNPYENVTRPDLK